MVKLSQRDSRWTSDRLGASNLQIGRFGCTITGCSMLSDYFGCYRSPRELAADKRNFTSGGLVIWTNLSFEKMRFEKRLYGYNEAAIKSSLLNPNAGVLLQVNHGQHWIVGLRSTYFTKDILCVDPWTAKTCVARADYKNITGSAHFLRK